MTSQTNWICCTANEDTLNYRLSTDVFEKKNLFVEVRLTRTKASESRQPQTSLGKVAWFGMVAVCNGDFYSCCYFGAFVGIAQETMCVF